MSKDSRTKEPKLVACVNCGKKFKPWSCFGPHFCGESKECDDAARDCEKEAYETAHDAVDQEFGRY